jgi:hypothetical protein
MLNAIRVSQRFGVAALALLSVALLLALSTPANAQMLPDRAVVTFSQPVEVPGHVLPPGTYVFRTFEDNSIVQVYSANEKQLFATASTIPTDRSSANNDECYFQLVKTRADAPQEVEEFYLPGHLNAMQFVYPSANEHHKGL